MTYETTDIDTTFLDSISLKEQFNNRHSYFTIPVFLGYEFNKNKWSLNLKTGLGVSLLVKTKSKYINYELNDFITIPPKKILFNYFVIPEIGYQYSDKLQFILSPQLVMNTQNSVPYEDNKQFYTNWGLNVGLSYSFSQF